MGRQLTGRRERDVAGEGYIVGKPGPRRRLGREEHAVEWCCKGVEVVGRRRARFHNQVRCRRDQRHRICLEKWRRDQLAMDMPTEEGSAAAERAEGRMDCRPFWG